MLGGVVTVAYFILIVNSLNKTKSAIFISSFSEFIENMVRTDSCGQLRNMLYVTNALAIAYM